MPFPYITETIQAAFLAATSNILAQGITAYQEDRTFSLDTVPITQFVSYAIINTPPNCAWQEWLESKFPGSSTSDPAVTHPAGDNAYNSRSKAKNKTAKRALKGEANVKKDSLNVRNTLTKFLLDQTVGAVVNTILFVVGISALKGMSWEGIVSAVKNDSLSLYLAGVKFWPVVSLISFTVLPVERRVVFGSIVGVGWGIFLSLVAAK